MLGDGKPNCAIQPEPKHRNSIREPVVHIAAREMANIYALTGNACTLLEKWTWQRCYSSVTLHSKLLGQQPAIVFHFGMPSRASRWKQQRIGESMIQLMRVTYRANQTISQLQNDVSFEAVALDDGSHFEH